MVQNLKLALYEIRKIRDRIRNSYDLERDLQNQKTEENLRKFEAFSLHCTRFKKYSSDEKHLIEILL